MAGVAAPCAPPRVSWSSGAAEAGGQLPGQARQKAWSAEDDGAAPVQQDALLRVPAHGPGQRDALGVTADGCEIVRGIRMIYPGDLLLDDRALVQVCRHVVRRGPNPLNAVCLRLMIGPRALEARQERVVDVDD